MGLFNNIFGAKPRDNDKASDPPFPMTGYFFEVGTLNDRDLRADLVERAEKILRFLQRKGCLARMLIQEPSPGYWGDTSKKYLESAVNALLSQVAMYEAEPNQGEFMVNLIGGQQKLTESSVFSEMHQDARFIKQAMDADKVKFMVGSRSNKCKLLAVLVHR